MNVRLKLSVGHYPVGPYVVRLEVSRNSDYKLDIVRVRLEIVQWDRTLSCERSLET
jgi:hypothetical protein